MDILIDPLEFIGVILAAATIIISIILYMRQRQKKGISYTIVSCVPLLSVGEEISGKLQILFDGKPVQQVHLVEADIVNSGNVPIKATEFERPISFSFGEEAQVFSAEVTESTPESLRATASIEGKRVLLEPTLLNAGDSVSLKMLISKFAKVDVDGRIVGVKRIGEFTKRKTRNVVLTAIGMIVQFSGAFLMMVSPFSPNPIQFLAGFALVMGGGLIGLYFLKRW